MKYAIYYSEKTQNPALRLYSSIRDEEVLMKFEAENFKNALEIALEKYVFDETGTKIPAIIIEPLEEPFYSFVEPSLKSLQALVEGNIEITTCLDCCECDIICNEEGKLMKLPLNRALYEDNDMYDIIAGTMVIAATDRKGKTIGLSNKTAVNVYEYFKRPELFHFDDDLHTIHALKCSFETGRLLKNSNIFLIS